MVPEDTVMQLPRGKLYPAVRRYISSVTKVRGPNSYEGLTRYSTYVLSYMAPPRQSKHQLLCRFVQHMLKSI